MSNILIVDDESDIRQVIKLALSSAGYQVNEAENGAVALQKIKEADTPAFNLIILDVTMPILSGIEVCKQLKADPSTASIPIIMLSAKTTEVEKVLGLEAGADDYLAKPFGVLELLARVKARLRTTNTPISETAENAHTPEATSGGIQHFGALALNIDSHEAFYNDERIALSPKEFDLLKLLFTNPQKTFSRDELMDYIWETDFICESRLVDQHVKNLRSKLKKFPKLRNSIQTMRSLGYRAAYVPEEQ